MWDQGHMDQVVGHRVEPVYGCWGHKGPCPEVDKGHVSTQGPEREPGLECHLGNKLCG